MRLLWKRAGTAVCKSQMKWPARNEMLTWFCATAHSESLPDHSVLLQFASNENQRADAADALLCSFESAMEWLINYIHITYIHIIYIYIPNIYIYIIYIYILIYITVIIYIYDRNSQEPLKPCSSSHTQIHTQTYTNCNQTRTRNNRFSS